MDEVGEERFKSLDEKLCNSFIQRLHKPIGRK